MAITKLFVGGLARETTEQSLREHFSSKYGESLVHSQVVRDKSTGNSKGFGFVSFSDSAAALIALDESHVIDGKSVEVKPSIPKVEQRQTTMFNPKKIFIGGLSTDVTLDELKSHFTSFGSISDAVVMTDKATNRPRGFGFIVFDLERSVDLVLQNPFHELKGKFVEVKRAIRKEKRPDVTCFTHYPPASFYNGVVGYVCQQCGIKYPWYDSGISNTGYPWYDSEAFSTGYVFPGHSINDGLTVTSVSDRVVHVIEENEKEDIDTPLAPATPPLIDGLRINDDALDNVQETNGHARKLDDIKTNGHALVLG